MEALEAAGALKSPQKVACCSYTLLPKVKSRASLGEAFIRRSHLFMASAPMTDTEEPDGSRVQVDGSFSGLQLHLAARTCQTSERREDSLQGLDSSLADWY